VGHSLIIRKRTDGRTIIESEVPEDHTFPARWIARELGELVEVTLTIRTSDGDKRYALEGFGEPGQGTGEPDEDAAVYTGWRMALIPEEVV
jgi:hypothetical protein